MQTELVKTLTAAVGREGPAEIVNSLWIALCENERQARMHGQMQGMAEGCGRWAARLSELLKAFGGVSTDA